MAEVKGIGYRVVGTIKSVKGHCNAGHKVGEQLELSGHNTAGMCGFSTTTPFPTSSCSSSAAASRSNGAAPTRSNWNVWIGRMLLRLS